MKKKIRNMLAAILGIYALAIVLETLQFADFGIYENFVEYNIGAMVLIVSSNYLNWKVKKENHSDSEYV